eukprot:753676-Hanusia_phi.AAC.6
MQGFMRLSPCERETSGMIVRLPRTSEELSQDRLTLNGWYQKHDTRRARVSLLPGMQRRVPIQTP